MIKSISLPLSISEVRTRISGLSISFSQSPSGRPSADKEPADFDVELELEVGSEYLPFTWKNRKFRLESQMALIILFGTFYKLLATGCGN